MLNRTIAILLIAFASSSVAGCGGSSGSDTLETSSLTKAQYIDRVEEICLEGTKDVPELLGNYISEHQSGPENEAELVADVFRESIGPKLETQVEEIAGLGAPQGDRARIEAYLAAQRDSIATLSKQREISLAYGFKKGFRKPGTLARQYGMRECAYN